MEKDKKINVLLCSPYQGAVGGISRWTGHILNNYMQLENNNEIELIHYYKHSKGTYQNTSKFVRFFRGLYTYIPFLYGLKRKLKSDNFDVVHLTSSASFSLLRDILAVNIAKKRNVKSIIHFHFGRIPELYTLKNWEQKLLHTVITMADYAVVIDQKSYDTLLAFGYKNIKLLPNPLTPKVVDIISKHNNIRVENRKLLFAGHVVVTKGVFELIEACKTIPNIQLKMIGYVTEEMKLELQSRAGEGYHQWLDIVGEVDFETTIKEMLSTEIFVLPTYTEGFPNVIIESMACGCPIVTTMYINIQCVMIREMTT